MKSPKPPLLVSALALSLVSVSTTAVPAQPAAVSGACDHTCLTRVMETFATISASWCRACPRWDSFIDDGRVRRGQGGSWSRARRLSGPGRPTSQHDSTTPLAARRGRRYNPQQGDFMPELRQNITATIRPGDEAGFVGECLEISVVTQGATLDETIENLREAVALHLEGENPAHFGLRERPTLLVTIEVQPTYAKAS